MVVQVSRGPDASAAPGRLLSRALAEEADPEAHEAIAAELNRQRSTLEMTGTPALAGRYRLYPDLAAGAR
jgi:hypothetical protein